MIPTFLQSKQRGSDLKWQPETISWLAVILFVTVAVLPFVLMLVKSFMVDGQVTLYNYSTVFSDPRVIKLLVKSFSISAGAAFLSLIFGVPFALILSRYDFPGRKMCSVLYLVPLFIPPHVNAIAWIYLFGPQGIAQKWFMQTFNLQTPLIQLYSVSGAIVILFLSYFPILILLTLTGLASIDGRMEESAGLRNKPLRVLRKITLPLVGPYMAAGTVFVFIFSFFNYGVPSMLRVPSFPVEIFTRFSAFYDEGGASALSLPMVIVALVLVGMQWRFMQRKTIVTTRSGSRNTLRTILPTKYALIASGYVNLILFVGIILPICSLFLQSGSLASFTAALKTSYSEIFTTLIIAALAAISTSLIAYFLTMHLTSSSTRCKNTLDLLTFLPFAFPAALFGIGLIYLWNRPWTQVIYGTSLILVIAYIARFIPFAIRIIHSRLQQIGPHLREAALMHEASWLKRLACIDLPLASRGILICGVITFIFCTSELGATLLVVPPGKGTMALKIYTLMHYGSGPLVAALALLLIGMNLLVSSVLLLAHTENYS